MHIFKMKTIQIKLYLKNIFKIKYILLVFLHVMWPLTDSIELWMDVLLNYCNINTISVGTFVNYGSD